MKHDVSVPGDGLKQISLKNSGGVCTFERGGDWGGKVHTRTKRGKKKVYNTCRAFSGLWEIGNLPQRGCAPFFITKFFLNL